MVRRKWRTAVQTVNRLVHRGKRGYPHQSYLRLSLRHGLSRNPEGFAVHFYVEHDLRHDALVKGVV